MRTAGSVEQSAQRQSRARSCFDQALCEGGAATTPPSGIQSEFPVNYSLATYGEVSEWLKELVLKTSRRETVSWVRIPPSPPVERVRASLGLFLW